MVPVILVNWQTGNFSWFQFNVCHDLYLVQILNAAALPISLIYQLLLFPLLLEIALFNGATPDGKMIRFCQILIIRLFGSVDWFRFIGDFTAIQQQANWKQYTECVKNGTLLSYFKRSNKLRNEKIIIEDILFRGSLPTNPTLFRNIFLKTPQSS